MAFFGYAAAVLLVLTLGAQIHQQWSRKSVEGVSPLLFIGQIAASAGFTVHSVMIGSWLFVVTNVAASLVGVAGLVIFLGLRRRGRRGARPAEA